MAVKIHQQIGLEIYNCATCGGPIALTASQDASLRTNHDRFYCSRAHGNSFAAPTAEEKLRAQLDKAQDRVAHLESENRSLTAMVDAANKKTRRSVDRADKGVCQHCHRHFVNVKRHVETKHRASILGRPTPFGLT